MLVAVGAGLEAGALGGGRVEAPIGEGPTELGAVPFLEKGKDNNPERREHFKYLGNTRLFNTAHGCCKGM